MKFEPLALAAAALAFAGTAHAFVEPTLWTVGDDGSTYARWTGSPGHPIQNSLTFLSDPALPSPTLSAVGAFNASSGGYYSFTDDYTLNATLSNYGSEGAGTWVLVQTGATLNPELIYPGEEGTGGSAYRDSFQIIDAAGNVLATSTVPDVIRTFYDPAYQSSFGEVQYEELAWAVFLPGYTGNFSLTFDEIIHSSFQDLRVDTWISPVPESSTYALLMAGLGVVGFVARRRG